MHRIARKKYVDHQLLIGSLQMTAKIVWRFIDGKLGHENQTLGFLQELHGLLELDVVDIGPEDRLSDLLKNAMPPPDLIVGAGHSVHMKMLIARLTRGGRTVLLMKPSIPVGFFDFVFVPKHDRCQSFGNVFFTDGVLNTVKPHPKEERLGLILIGGESKHFPWDSDYVSAEVQQIVENNPDMTWQIFDSRRTPIEITERVGSLPTVESHNWKTTPPGFLSSRMAVAEVIWVTCDSVSMLYEALSSGAFVGVLELPALRVALTGRKIWRSIQSLVSADRVQLSNDGLVLDTTKRRRTTLNESLRCAKIVAQSLYR